MFITFAFGAVPSSGRARLADLEVDSACACAFKRKIIINSLIFTMAKPTSKKLVSLPSQNVIKPCMST